MRPPRLSYGTAGIARRHPVEPMAVPRLSPPARVAAGLAAPPRQGRSTARRRPFAIATLLLLHGAAVIGLLNMSHVRESAAEARPVFLATLAAPAPVAPPRPLPPPPAAKMPTPPPLQLPLIAPDPSASPSPLVAQLLAPPPAAAAPAVDPTPAPAPVALPRSIPAAGVQFLVPPTPAYSRVSARMRESGNALIRVFIDEAGMPRHVQLAASTGFSRLDESALAAVRAARFKPYLENGVAVAGWASVPIEFELPQ
jgi:protein TonB